MKIKPLLLAAVMMLSTAAPAAAARVPGVDDKMEGATKGIVAVSHPVAAQTGKMILERGGNVVDAAAAIQLSLNVVEPMMSGIGGGGFMMIYRKDQNKITIIDSRETAPRNVDPKLFLDADGNPIPFYERHTNGKAVAVPGTLKGLETALNKYGTMKLSEVIEPAIEQAEKGVPVNWITAQYIAEETKKLQQHSTAGQVFVPTGTPLKEGELLVQPELARTLKLIQEKGSDVLYNGEVGEALVAEVQKLGGTMTMEDLHNYTVKEREPVRTNYRGYDVVSMSPPSSGGLTVLQILKLMEGYDAAKMGLNSADYLHRLIESMHLAYADRAKFMADEDVYPVPKQGLLDDKYISERRKLINPDRANTAVTAGDPWAYEGAKPAVPDKADKEKKPIGQTTHFSVMDQWGNMVSYTTTIEQVFGSGIMVPGYGFMLNNEMTDFDAEPGGVNQVEPGKRPRSSMSPTLVLKDGQPFMAVGSPGGPTIIASVAQTIMNVIDHGLSIQQAILAPRIYSSSYPTVLWENGINQNVVLQLMAKGHVFEQQPQNIGNVQAVIFDFEHNKMYGGTDDTRQGTVLGVDNVSFMADAPEAAPQPEKEPFTLKVNNVAFPYFAGQMLVKDGRTYILADKLLLGLGAESTESYEKRAVVIEGRSYLPVRNTAEALGYQVWWDNANRTVLLTKEIAQSANSEMNDYYKDDKFQITK